MHATEGFGIILHGCHLPQVLNQAYSADTVTTLACTDSSNRPIMLFSSKASSLQPPVMTCQWSCTVAHQPETWSALPKHMRRNTGTVPACCLSRALVRQQHRLQINPAAPMSSLAPCWRQPCAHVPLPVPM
jgi:hypothetical protein